MKFFQILCLSAVCVSSVSITSPASVEECIRDLSSDVNFITYNTTTDSEYNDHRIGVNRRIDDHYPVLIVNVTSVEHIQAAVICADYFSMQVIPMNGGHSFEGLSTTMYIQLNMDMYNNATIDISDSTNPTVTVQSGIRLARLYGLLVEGLYSNASAPAPYYLLAGGTCPTVGVTGHVVCGGYGMFGRTIGLTSDQILSFEVVNASGAVITASSTHNPDIFWALRGSCSSSFGLISTITFRLHEHVYGPNITVFTETTISGSAAMIQAATWFQSYATYNATPLMTMNINFKANNKITLEGVFLGNKSLALSYMLEPLTSGLAGIFTEAQLQEMFVEGSYLDAVLWWSGGSYTSVEDLVNEVALSPLSQRSASRRKAKSALVRGVIDAEGIQLIADLFTNGSINQMEWKAYGGVDPITGSFPYTTPASPLLRGHLFEAHYSSSYTASGDNDTSITDMELEVRMNEVQSMLETIPGFSNQSYVGYIDLNSTTDKAMLGEVYFGSVNAARLRALRSVVDPRGVLTSVTSEFLYPSLNISTTSSSGSGDGSTDITNSTSAATVVTRYLGDTGKGNTVLTCKKQFGVIVCDEWD